MLGIVSLVIFYFTFPLLIIYLCKKWTLFQKIGTIALAYGFGLLLGSSGIFPEASEEYTKALQGRAVLPSKEFAELYDQGKLTEQDTYAYQIASAQDLIQTIVVPLAFPLLFFSLNIRRWMKYARRGFISVVLALIAGLVMVTTGFFIWKDSIPESWKLAGMFEGIYTGGTPNFVAIKMALDVDPDLFVIVSTYDIIVGAGLVLFFITLAPGIFRKILPVFSESNGINAETAAIVSETVGYDDFTGMLKKKTLIPLLKALGLSMLIFAVAGGISLALPMLPQMLVVILTITSLGIIASLNKYINQIKKTFQLGMYLILVFSLTLASMADLRAIFNIGMKDLILFISWCYFGSMILHLILAKIFRIDADNFLITATAFVFSPPFVPLVANALKNKDVMVTGIAGGVIGYILGNYFGVALAYFLKGF